MVERDRFGYPTNKPILTIEESMVAIRKLYRGIPGWDAVIDEAIDLGNELAAEFRSPGGQNS